MQRLMVKRGPYKRQNIGINLEGNVRIRVLVIVDPEIDKLPAEERQRYLAAWKKFKLLRNTTVAGMILFCVFGFLDFRRPNRWWFALALLSLVVTSPASLAFQRWKCPRCFSDRGATRWGWQQPWIRRCYWCELRKSDLADLEKRDSSLS
ncbi:MAG TPA: hypothetical protein VNY81_07825 [Candidatus Saccharimonadales bacterium]|jgi:hypothetical protein|nr:hypothetical protein [Candidatus Saccharimonadales bacterium]